MHKHVIGTVGNFKMKNNSKILDNYKNNGNLEISFCNLSHVNLYNQTVF